jgi:hypothetical protein
MPRIVPPLAGETEPAGALAGEPVSQRGCGPCPMAAGPAWATSSPATSPAKVSAMSLTSSARLVHSQPVCGRANPAPGRRQRSSGRPGGRPGASARSARRWCRQSERQSYSLTSAASGCRRADSIPQGPDDAAIAAPASLSRRLCLGDRASNVLTCMPRRGRPYASPPARRAGTSAQPSSRPGCP